MLMTIMDVMGCDKCSNRSRTSVSGINSYTINLCTGADGYCVLNMVFMGVHVAGRIKWIQSKNSRSLTQRRASELGA